MNQSRTKWFVLSWMAIGTSLALSCNWPNSGAEKSKIEIQELNAALEKCETDLSNVRREFEWVSRSYATIAPDTIRELEKEQQKILTLVPAVVQDEISARLDDYSTVVVKKLSGLSNQLASLESQYKAQRQENQELMVQLRAVGESVTSSNSETGDRIDSLLEDSRAERARWQRYAGKLAGEIEEFTKRLTCKDCGDRIKVKRGPRDEIARFHQNLVARLEAFTDSM